MTMKESAHKVLQYIYDKTVDDDNNDELSVKLSLKSTVKDLGISVAEYYKSVEYLLEKGYVRKGNTEDKRHHAIITASGIDYIEDNL